MLLFTGLGTRHQQHLTRQPVHYRHGSRLQFASCADGIVICLKRIHYCQLQVAHPAKSRNLLSYRFPSLRVSRLFRSVIALSLRLRIPGILGVLPPWGSYSKNESAGDVPAFASGSGCVPGIASGIGSGIGSVGTSIKSLSPC